MRRLPCSPRSASHHYNGFLLRPSQDGMIAALQYDTNEIGLTLSQPQTFPRIRRQITGVLIMRMRYLNVLGLLLLITAQSSLAQGFFDPHVRAGIGGGQLQFEEDGFDAHSTAWSIFAGFELNRYIAAEAGYFKGNSPQDDYLDEVAGIYEFLDVPNYGWHATAIGSWPIGESAVVYARAGAALWKAEGRYYINGVLIDSFEDDGVDPIYGLGVGLNIDNGLLRLEYTRTQILDLDASYVSLSAVWRFGF